MKNKRVRTSLQTIIVTITILATVLGLLGLSFFSSYEANNTPPPSAANKQSAAQVPVSISDIQTSGGGKVEVVPVQPGNTSSPSK